MNVLQVIIAQKIQSTQFHVKEESIDQLGLMKKQIVVRDIIAMRNLQLKLIVQ